MRSLLAVVTVGLLVSGGAAFTRRTASTKATRTLVRAAPSKVASATNGSQVASGSTPKVLASTAVCTAIDNSRDLSIANGPKTGAGHAALERGEAAALAANNCPAEPPVTLTTTTPSTVALGSSVSDIAHLAGDAPTGTVSFTLFTNGGCTGTGTPKGTVTVSGDGNYTSSSFTPTAPGSYSWSASYSGDAQNASATSACEPFTVTAASPTLTTETPASVAVGTPIQDTAHLSGGFNPTGAIGFTVFANSSCTGPSTDVLPTQTVSGNGTYTSGTFTPMTAGSYSWVAFYQSGDANNSNAASACEPFTVTGAGPTLTTTTSATVAVGSPIADLATLAGGFNPTGGIGFSVFPSGDCTGTPVFTSTNPNVNGNGDYASDSFTPTAAGSYSWVAFYSGDANNNSAAAACEPFTAL